MALQAISHPSISLLLRREDRAALLVFFQSLLDDGHPLLVRLSGCVPLERTQLLRSKARNPHVPVPLENNLDFEINKVENFYDYT